MPIALVSDIHGNDRALANGSPRSYEDVLLPEGSVGISDDGLVQLAILTGASVSFMQVPWNGR